MRVYRALALFLLPLALTLVAQDLGGQFLNAGMARAPQATQTLAAFGLAWGLVTLFVMPLYQVKQLGLVLVDGRHSWAAVQRFVWAAGALLSTVVALLALGAPGRWVVETLHGIKPPLSAPVREAILWLAPLPLLRANVSLYAGLLIRIRRTDLTGYAVLAGLMASVLAVAVLIPAPFVRVRPIRLPVLVTYTGTLTELAVLLCAQRRFAAPRLLAGTGEPLSSASIIGFFWPLALIMTVQGLSRPLINLFVARETGGGQALAVLTIVYALALLPYGWLNEIRSIAPAFYADLGRRGVSIRRFATACGALSFAVMVVLFWTPLRDLILGSWIGAGPALVAQAKAPLVIFSFFPLAVTIRSYFHGVSLVERQTRILAPSAPARIAAVVVALVLLPYIGVTGATRGVAALLCGFVVEALVVWWGVLATPARAKERLVQP